LQLVEDLGEPLLAHFSESLRCQLSVFKVRGGEAGVAELQLGDDVPEKVAALLYW
jgi:hypothetical protein